MLLHRLTGQWITWVSEGHYVVEKESPKLRVYAVMNMFVVNVTARERSEVCRDHMVVLTTDHDTESV